MILHLDDAHEMDRVGELVDEDVFCVVSAARKACSGTSVVPS